MCVGTLQEYDLYSPWNNLRVCGNALRVRTLCVCVCECLCVCVWERSLCWNALRVWERSACVRSVWVCWNALPVCVGGRRYMKFLLHFLNLFSLLLLCEV